MDPKDAETYKWNIFDMTKVWPHKDYPLRQIGRLTMNRNVSYIFQPLSLYSIRDGKSDFFFLTEANSLKTTLPISSRLPSHLPLSCPALPLLLILVCHHLHYFDSLKV